MIKKLTILLLVLLIIISGNEVLRAEKWNPFKFQGTEKFNYLIELYEGEELRRELHYIVELNPTDQTDENGEKLYEVSYR